MTQDMRAALLHGRDGGGLMAVRIGAREMLRLESTLDGVRELRVLTHQGGGELGLEPSQWTEQLEQ